MDIDFDGASNTAELIAGTNPYDADTDNDGVPDGMELNWNNDTDGNGRIFLCKLENGTEDIVIKYNDDINALDPDSDNDSIKDGVEMGVTGHVFRSGVDHSTNTVAIGSINWVAGFEPEYKANPENFPTSNYEADSDPDTITNMTLTDTDNDGRTDYQEDTNANGQQDQSESDPLDMDTDDDGLMDGHLFECGGAMKDSDGDGVYNCLDPDSDDDGLYDGLEAGVTVPIQGNDEIEGTDIDAGYFIRDMEPINTTDPTDPDSDDDGIKDGTEDENHNGAWDILDETDPNDVDTDDDGLNDGLNDANDPGEDTDNDGIVDDGESDPLKKDTDGDTLWDGDEVNPEDIDKDDVPNRYDPDDSNVWYDSDPTKLDTDGDDLHDDEELLGWDVRIFWEATLETMKGPYNVYSDPETEDTDGDNLDDKSEFMYGSDPHEADTDDDNTNDGQEVIDGDNPCGIEGKPPDVKYLTLSATPVVTENSGLYYFKGWKIKLNIKIEDSSGPYFIRFKEMNGKPVQKYLQGTDEEYYVTDLIAEIEVEVLNNGDFDYASGFYAYVEDSVGNNVSVFIAAGGLPCYSTDEIRNIYSDETTVGVQRSLEGVEWMTQNGSAAFSEGLDWLFDNLAERIKHQLNLIIEKEDIYNQTKYSRFMLGLDANIKKGNDYALDYIMDFDFSLSSQNNDNGGTRSNGDDRKLVVIAIPPGIKAYIKDNNKNLNLYKYLFDQFGFLNFEPFEDDDGDGLQNYLELIYKTVNDPLNTVTDDINGITIEETKDSDLDGVSDPHEFRTIFRTNFPYGNYLLKGTEYFIAFKNPIFGYPYEASDLEYWCVKWGTTQYIFTLNELVNGNCRYWEKGTKFSDLRIVGYTIENYPIYLTPLDRPLIFSQNRVIFFTEDIFVINPEHVTPYPSTGTDYREMVMIYTEPNEEDTDDDGLLDRFEVNERKFLTNNEQIVFDSIPDIEKPNPRGKDIYVEIDWLDGFHSEVHQKNKKPPNDILDLLWFISSGEYENKLVKVTVRTHQFEEDSKNLVIAIFNYYGISLHIDDGTGGWSGGTNIPHIDDFISDDEFNGDTAFPDINQRTITGDNTIYADYFTDERVGIFHYVLFAHHIVRSSDGATGFQARTPRNGMRFTDSTIISDQKIKDIAGYDFKSVYITKVFMHELGHHFGLEHPLDNTPGANPKFITSMYSNERTLDSLLTIVNYADAPDGWTDGNPNNNEWQELKNNMHEIRLRRMVTI